MTDDVRLAVTDGVARITLNRPERLNAVGRAAAAAWRDACAEAVARDDVRAIVIDAAGPGFCAGGDVREMAEAGLSGAEVAETAGWIHEGMASLREGATPVVAAVHGAVAGGGLGFALIADVVVAGESAVFVSKYADIGLTPDCGVSTLLPEAMGPRRAKRFLLSDIRLSARDALAEGLAEEVVADDALAARVGEIAAGWAAGPARAYGQARRLVDVALHRPFRESLDDEAATIGAAFDGEEAAPRIRAFAAGAGR